MDQVLFFAVVLLAVAGIITVYSASSVIALQSNPPLPADYYAHKQLISVAVGLVAMVGLSYIPYRIWYKFMAPILLGNFLLLFLVLAVGWSTNGGKRWIGHGALHLQPSELSMIAIAIYLAYIFTKKVTLMHNFQRGVLPALVMVGLNVGLIFAEPDMGTGFVLLAMSLVVIFSSGAKIKPLVIFIGCLIIPGLIGFSMISYRSARISAWLHPFQHTDTISYQLVQGLTAISAGNWFGRGFGQSIEKMGYLPYPQTDFIFPVFVEEWGLVGAGALVATFGILVWRGFSNARRSPDRFGALLCVGLTSQVILSALINLGAVTGLIPVTGIPLPFISYGGTDVIVDMASIGILLSVSRVTLDVEPEADELAPVIDVTDAIERRERTPRPLREKPPLVGVDAETAVHRQQPQGQRNTRPMSGPRNSAEVHRLSPRKRRSSQRTAVEGSWSRRHSDGQLTSPSDRQVAATRETGKRASLFGKDRKRADTIHAHTETRKSSSRWRETAQPAKRPAKRPAKTWRERQGDMSGYPPSSSGKKQSKRPFGKGNK